MDPLSLLKRIGTSFANANKSSGKARLHTYPLSLDMVNHFLPTREEHWI